MLTATLIVVAIGFMIGALSSASEKLFIVLAFIGLPALGFGMKFVKGFSFPFHAPDGTTHIARIKDLFFQIPEEYRLGFFLFAPAFMCGRIITASLVKNRKEKSLTPDQIRAKKHQILKSYT